VKLERLVARLKYNKFKFWWLKHSSDVMVLFLKEGSGSKGRFWHTLRNMAEIDVTTARRLALARAGLLKPEWTGLPARAAGRGRRARNAAHEVIRRFGYLQLDTVSIAGARSHAIVLHSRLDGFDISLGEELLRAGEPLFEYWGHEVCWIPIELYPVFGFRRREFQAHPWWGDLVGKHPEAATEIRRRLREDGPLRSADLDGSRAGQGGWWNLKTARNSKISPGLKRYWKRSIGRFINVEVPSRSYLRTKLYGITSFAPLMP
jgi:hypothetical protein